MIWLICNITNDRCSCGHCAPMPLPGKCRCCAEINVISDLLEKDGVQCITDHQGFKPVYLNPYVLKTAYNQYNHEIPNPSQWVVKI